MLAIGGKVERFKVKGERGKKLSQQLATVLGSRKRAKRLIDEGLVSVNYRKELLASRPLKGREVIIFPLPKELFKRPQVKLLKREGKVWVFSKPPFITSNEGKRSLEEIVRREFNHNLRVVHRLDKQTTGVIVAVEGKELFEEFKELFKRREVKKEYLALVKGELRGKRVITAPIDGKGAKTTVEPLKTLKGATLVRAEIETGRKHQIRRHLAQIGHPVVGEFKYYRGSWREELLTSPRILLHSSRISFKSPENGKLIEVEAPIPKDFNESLEWLKEEGN